MISNYFQLQGCVQI